MTSSPSFLKGVHYRDDAMRVAEKVLAAFGAPFAFGKVEVIVGASLGIALADNSDQDAEARVRRADTAIYRVQAGGGRRFELYDGQPVGRPAPEYRAVA